MGRGFFATNVFVTNESTVVVILNVTKQTLALVYLCLACRGVGHPSHCADWGGRRLLYWLCWGPNSITPYHVEGPHHFPANDGTIPAPYLTSAMATKLTKVPSSSWLSVCWERWAPPFPKDRHCFFQKFDWSNIFEIVNERQSPSNPPPSMPAGHLFFLFSFPSRLCVMKLLMHGTVLKSHRRFGYS